jgi:hypothetical protein
LIASAIARWVLPVPGGPKKQTFLCSAVRERGVADAVARPRGVAREHLGLEQDLEELLVGPALLARGGGGLPEALQDPGCLELAEQIGQAVADRGRLGLGAHAQSSA